MGNRPSYPGTPRWVKVSGIMVIVLVMLVAIMLLSGKGPTVTPRSVMLVAE